MLQNVENAVHDPVSEPLSVIILRLRLDRLERLVGRVHKANKVDDELEAAKSVDDEKEREESDAANHVRWLERWVLGLEGVQLRLDRLRELLDGGLDGIRHRLEHLHSGLGG